MNTRSERSSLILILIYAFQACQTERGEPREDLGYEVEAAHRGSEARIRRRGCGEGGAGDQEPTHTHLAGSLRCAGEAATQPRYDPSHTGERREDQQDIR
jgi:hypothetical protein